MSFWRTVYTPTPLSSRIYVPKMLRSASKCRHAAHSLQASLLGLTSLFLCLRSTVRLWPHRRSRPPLPPSTLGLRLQHSLRHPPLCRNPRARRQASAGLTLSRGFPSTSSSKLLLQLGLPGSMFIKCVPPTLRLWWPSIHPIGCGHPTLLSGRT